MVDKGKEANWKGYNDAQKPRPSVVSELATGTNYQPPSSRSGQKEAYKAGWDRAKSEKK